MTSYWAFTIQMEELRPTQKKMLEADIEYFKWDAIDQAYTLLHNLRAQRGWKSKLVLWAKKNNFVDTALSVIESNLSLVEWDKLNFIEYSISEVGDTTTLLVKIDQQIFEMWNEIKKNGKLFSVMTYSFKGFDKKTIIERFQKEVVQNYTKKYRIDELP